MLVPIEPPIAPMLARRADVIPTGEAFLYEPKWDGFRALAFRGEQHLMLQSRDLKDIGRYFPELRDPLLEALPAGTVVDGEIVIALGDSERILDFDALLARIHPAASRIDRLARETPASYVLFDLLAIDGEDLRATPFGECRARLLDRFSSLEPPLHVTPSTEEVSVARDWFHRFEGAGLDGVVAKRRDLAYEPGKRSMIKVKHDRTADCVLGGFRWHKGGEGRSVGSLLLGLYDSRGLEHVGVAASFGAAMRARLARELAPLVLGADEAHPWRSEH
ncbi:MAG: ATP-dependent DNA ligase, partial [Polyangiaceae bacterium]|nr:ATP-dependent DNA ligase [Polyangiaceae bacterium]